MERLLLELGFMLREANVWEREKLEGSIWFPR